jgi:hypothetical protein
MGLLVCGSATIAFGFVTSSCCELWVK